MKKINFAKCIWVLSIFLVLIVILIAVMDYKINYEYKTKNVLYFYECDGRLCVTEVEDDEHLLYSKYECSYDECPIFVSEFEDNYAILDSKDSKILYNYRKGKVISNSYDNYNFLNNNYLIVTKGDYHGIIDFDNKIVVSLIYEELGYIKDDYLVGYGLNYIVAKKDGKYGIISLKNEEIIEEFIYEETNIDDVLNVLNEKEKLL